MMNLDLSYYVSVFLRRLHVFLIVAAGVTAAGVYVAMTLPPMYNAQARLLVESAQIPNELAASTVTTGAEEQLAVIEQLLMTRANLIDIANSLKVFGPPGQMSADAVVSRMRSQSTIERRGRGATLLEIGFQSSDPQVAARVTNEYLTRILQQNVEIRTGRAEDTQDFFKNEVDQLGLDLDRLSARIVDFKNANSGALPDSLDFRMTRQSFQQERLAQIDRDLDAIDEKRERLRQLFDSGASFGIDRASLSPEERRLADLRDELENALVVYSPTNPRVRILQARVQQMEQQIAKSAPSSGDAEASVDPRQVVLDMQLAELDAQEGYLTEQRGLAEAELKTLEASIAKTPQNAVTLDALERDYSNIQSQYNSAVDRLAKAATGERIELLSKGQRISVIEQASVPNRPTSPNRVMIAGGGGAAGILLGAAVVLLLELLNQSIRRPVDLQNRLGIAPLVTLPYVRTRQEIVVKRSIVLLLIVAVVVGVPALLFAVHTFYLPLDLIVSKISARILP